MKNALPALVLFIACLSICLPAAGQFSLADRLRAAAESGDNAAVESLLDKGADINSVDKGGTTALMYAVAFSRRDVVELLLRRGADMEIKDGMSVTAIFKIVSSQASTPQAQIDILKLLLDKGADYELLSPDGHTPLIAISAYCPSSWGKAKATLAQLLLEKGANPEVKDKSGKTALDYANTEGPAELVDLLEDAMRQRKQADVARLKDPKVQFALQVQALQHNPKDESLREKVIQLALALPEPPPVPEEARQLFQRATSQIKLAIDPGQLDPPIALLRSALELAPWWANAYFNLSRALELNGRYDEAIQQMNYYLEIKPSGLDADEARIHLLVLQKEKEAAKKQR